MRRPGPHADEDLRRRAAAILAASASPVTSAALAEALLGMVRAPEAAARAVLGSILTGDARFVCSSAGAWRLASAGTARPVPGRTAAGGRHARRFLPAEGAEDFEDPSGTLAQERRAIVLARRDRVGIRERGASGSGGIGRGAWAVWEIDPELRAAAVVRIENGVVAAELAESIDDDRTPRSRAPRRTLSPAALRRLGACARGARWAHFASGRVIAGLEQALAASGALHDEDRWEPHHPEDRRGDRGEDRRGDRDEDRRGDHRGDRGDDRSREVPPGPPLVLARAALAILGPPRPASIEDLAARLGERIVAADTPLERARAAASCLERLIEIGAAAGPAGGGSGFGAFGDGAARAWTFAASGSGQDSDHRWSVGEPAEAAAIRLAARIATLPSSAGVYRFLSEDGALLYVGKAVNLRRRVASYFHRRAAPDPRTAAWIGRVARIEFDEAGSEPEALAREAEAIIRSGPAANRQRAVHDRPAPAASSTRRGLADAENVVLLLPAGKGGLVHAHLLRRGVPVARVVLGPRGGGTSSLRALLGRFYFTGGTDSPPTPSEPRRRRAALFSSWLARQTKPVSAFDPTDAATTEDALVLALRYASGLRLGESGVVYRS